MAIEKKVLLSPNDIFAIYRLPKSKEIVTVIQRNNDLNDFDENCLQKKGFIFFPFDESQNSPIFINADEVYYDLEFSYVQTKYKTNKNITQSDYLKKAKLFINDIKKDFRKIVLSRTKSINNNHDEIYYVFSKLENKYKDAMVFLVNTPQTGTWMGATPEKLLEYNNNQAKTIALAGTQFVNNIQSISWESKEIEEQKAVMDYIHNILTLSKIDFVENGPYTKIAARNNNGTLIHLATDYSFKLMQNKFDLIKKLHPTPAVSGFPKQDSINYIKKNEGYNREYYTGFLGPTNIKKSDSFHLYVNLRSMKVFKNEYLLFLGGGLNSNSNPLKEWNETENKAKTLEDIIHSKQ